MKYMKEKVDILMKYLVSAWKKLLKCIQFMAVCTDRSRMLPPEVFNKKKMFIKRK